MKTFAEEVAEFHAPEAVEQPMVYEVWSDGEITLTKGGNLYKQRNLHTIYPAALPAWQGERLIDLFPSNNGTYGSMPVEDEEQALALRELLKSWYE